MFERRKRDNNSCVKKSYRFLIFPFMRPRRYNSRKIFPKENGGKQLQTEQKADKI